MIYKIHNTVATRNIVGVYIQSQNRERRPDADPYYSGTIIIQLILPFPSINTVQHPFSSNPITMMPRPLSRAEANAVTFIDPVP